MAVTQIEEIPNGKGGSDSGPENRSVTRVFRVTTNSKADTPADMQSSLTVKWGDPLPTYSEYTCSAISWAIDNWGPSRSVWTATCDYRTNAIDAETLEAQQTPNPIDRRARLTVRSVRYGKLTNSDRDGKAHLTSAGEVYPPIEIDASRWQIQVRKNYTDIPDWVWTYQDKLNDSSITVRGRILEPETVKFGEVVVPEITQENGVNHYKIEFTLDYRLEGWVTSRLDAGFYYVNSSGDYVRAIDQNDEAAVVEQLLDGSGGLLYETLGATPTPGDESYNDFNDYETADFSILPLNES